MGVRGGGGQGISLPIVEQLHICWSFTLLWNDFDFETLVMLRARPSSPLSLQTRASAVRVLLASRRMLCALCSLSQYQVPN